MQALFLRVITLSLGCSAVLLPLLLLSRLIRRRYAARTCYFLWLLVAFRLLLPVSLTLPEPVVTVEAPGYAVSLRRLEAPIPEYAAPGSSEGASGAAPSDPVTLPADGVPTAAEPVSKVPLTELLAVLWLAGGAAFLLWQGGTYLMVRRRLLSRAVSAEETELALLRRQQSELGLHRSVELRRVEGLPTPMMLGLLRPVILLPAAWLEEDALSMVLRHELVHLRRNDVAYKGLLLLANAVHWFNPLVWWMDREAGRNLELCCDDDVVRGQDGAFRRRYGEILLHTAAECRAPALSTYFGGGKRQMKGRLSNLFQNKKNSAVLVCTVLAVTVLVGSLVVCRAAGEGPVSETEAIDRLEQSVEYDAESGILSFTIPDVEVPSQPWQILFTGRAGFADGMGMSLHYHTDTQWEPGETYTENLGEIADNLTELFLHVTLGMVEQPIDLLPHIRPGTVSQGRTDRPPEEMTPEEQAVEALVKSLVFDGGGFHFTVPDYGAPEDWRIRITGKDAQGSSHHHGSDCDYHYLAHEGIQPGLTYHVEIPVEDLLMLKELNLRVWLGDAFRLISLLDHMVLPLPGTYVMEYPEGGGADGEIFVPALTIRPEEQTFILVSDLLSSYIAAGTYAVEDGRIICATNDGVYHYVFEWVDGNTLRFDQNRSSGVVNIDSRFAAPVQEGAQFRRTAAPAEPSAAQAPATAEAVDISGYRAVLLGEEEFLYTGNGQREYLTGSSLGESFPDSSMTFAAADMDGDGMAEVAVMLEEAGRVSILLDRREGTVYGYEAYYRWFMPLKADGRTCWSAGASNWGWGFVRFGETEFTYDRMNYCDGWDPARYVVNGKAATREEFDTASEEWAAGPDAAWHALTEETVERLCAE